MEAAAAAGDLVWLSGLDFIALVWFVYVCVLFVCLESCFCF